MADPQERKALPPPRLFVSEQGVGEPAAAESPDGPAGPSGGRRGMMQHANVT